MDIVRRDPPPGQRPLNGGDRKALGMGRAAGANGRRRLILGAAVAMLDAATARADRSTTTDDLADPEPGAHRAGGGKWLGSVPRLLARAGVVRRDGYTPSARPSRHSTPIARWVLCVPADAVRAHRAALAAELAALEADADPQPHAARGYDLFAGVEG